ncbi:YaaA family protein [Tannockella kyphosi]|uniref:YaaA family protein n=1 Tax=Tannockella kyphosi TaxID=2899121 RepID=UPI002011A3EC|nr:YaaA family protein [Tannockella kyphosi]
MKIIVSPTKQMIKTSNHDATTKPLFLEKTKYIQNILESMSKEEIHTNFKISFALVDDVYKHIHHKEINSSAIYLYTGTVFKQLQLNSYSLQERQYINNYTRILSSYYGLLLPSDEVSPYRLDMLTKFPISLYHYWQESIDNYFEKEDFIISLASKEYSSMLKHPNIIEIDFVVKNGPTLTRNAMHVKKARGMMLHACIKNNIQTIEQLIKLEVDGYCYQENLSTSHHLVFMFDKRKL